MSQKTYVNPTPMRIFAKYLLHSSKIHQYNLYLLFAGSLLYKNVTYQKPIKSKHLYFIKRFRVFSNNI